MFQFLFLLYLFSSWKWHFFFLPEVKGVTYFFAPARKRTLHSTLTKKWKRFCNSTLKKLKTYNCNYRVECCCFCYLVSGGAIFRDDPPGDRAAKAGRVRGESRSAFVLLFGRENVCKNNLLNICLSLHFVTFYYLIDVPLLMRVWMKGHNKVWGFNFRLDG